MFAADVLWVKAVSVIAHTDRNCIQAKLQLDANIFSLGMLENVVERFLHHPEEGDFYRWRNFMLCTGDIHAELDASALVEQVSVPA